MADYDYVRRAYGVDPKHGQRVRHNEVNRFGVVAPERPSQGHYVMVVFDGATEALPCHPTALDYDADDRHLLPMWIIYDHPKDYPKGLIARRWVSFPQPTATHAVRTATRLEDLREGFFRDGCSRLDRSPSDDPCIVETWLV